MPLFTIELVLSIQLSLDSLTVHEKKHGFYSTKTLGLPTYLSEFFLQ